MNPCDAAIKAGLNCEYSLSIHNQSGDLYVLLGVIAFFIAVVLIAFAIAWNMKQ